MLPSPLTVEAGTNFIFGPSTYLSVESQGSLNALGSAGNLIRFMGEQSVEGSWSGIRFTNSASVNNEFQYCDFGSGGSDPSWDAMIYLYYGARLKLGNSSIHNSYTWGLIEYQGTNTFINDGNNSFYGNLQGDIGN